MADLKACPFCGSDNVYMKSRFKGSIIVCPKCGATVAWHAVRRQGAHTIWESVDDECIVKRWNSRRTMTKKKEHYLV